MDVNTSMTDKAILAGKENSYSPRTIFTTNREMTNAKSKTIKGFIFFTKVNRMMKSNNEPGLRNAISDPAKSLRSDSNIRGNVF